MMPVPLAFATIICVWSTTPLGISWSNETLSPIAAVCLRMGLAALLGYVFLRVSGIRVDWHRQACRTYGYSLMGVYGAMFCTYSAANYIPSGLISVLFALAPVMSNVFAIKILARNDFSLARWMAFLVSFSGLAVICFDDLVIADDGWIGVLLLLTAVVLYSLSGVLLQREQYQGHPLSTTVGSLIMSMPLFLLTWYAVDGKIPELDWHSKSPWAVLYLSVFGSLFGFAAYFYLVKVRGATAVAMVTLVTPVMALFLGCVFNDEPLSLQIIAGTVLVLTGLLFYYQDAGAGLIQRKTRLS